MGRPIKWSFQPDKRHEAIAKDACGGYEKLKADIAEKEKMLAEIKQEQAVAISDLERGIKEEMYAECKTPSVFGFSDTEAAHHGRCV